MADSWRYRLARWTWLRSRLRKPLAARYDIARDRSEVAEFCGALDDHLAPAWPSVDAVRALQVALDELLTNVVDYAQGGSTDPIGLSLAADTNAITVEIRYRADAYDPTARAAPDTTLSVADRPIGGLGVHLVQQMMDAFTHRYEDGHNVLTLVKRD